MAIDARFDLPPEKAIKFFRSKGYVTSFDWRDMWQEQHDSAFTVAKMMDVDLLRDVRKAVDAALAEGLTAEQFRERLEPTLTEAGWWGKKEMVDPATGDVEVVQLGSARRLRTIMRVNLQTAYQAGHWQQIQETKESAPYLMYDAVDDSATRSEHRQWDGKVLPADDPWWQTHMPPNGFGCRCGVIQLSQDQVRSMGLKVESKAPAGGTYEYQNPRTGEVSQVPKGVDPGWAYNPGASRADFLKTQLEQKTKEYRDGR